MISPSSTNTFSGSCVAKSCPMVMPSSGRVCQSAAAVWSVHQAVKSRYASVIGVCSLGHCHVCGTHIICGASSTPALKSGALMVVDVCSPGLSTRMEKPPMFDSPSTQLMVKSVPTSSVLDIPLALYPPTFIGVAEVWVPSNHE